MALKRIETTETYDLYQTSAIPTKDGLQMYTITEPGVQTLVLHDEPVTIPAGSRDLWINEWAQDVRWNFVALPLVTR